MGRHSEFQESLGYTERAWGGGGGRVGGPGREGGWLWLTRGPQLVNHLQLQFSILNFQTIADFGSLKPWTMQPVTKERPPSTIHIHKCTCDRGPNGAEWAYSHFAGKAFLYWKVFSLS